MKVTPCGVRGSIAAPGPTTARYGGNTSCVRVSGEDGTVLALDAGTGIRTLALPPGLRRVDVLLTHLHMDHIIGLGFFGPLFDPAMEVHIWGPASATLTLEARLRRYLAPPLFPVLLRDVPCRLELHHTGWGRFAIGAFDIRAARVCHPGPTMGYRIETGGRSLAYLPDHEPALVPFPSTGSGPRASIWRAESICSCTTPSTPARSTRGTSAGGTARCTTRWPSRSWRTSGTS